jgi:hypothetical protein
MTLPQQIANHFRQVHFGGNWTAVNLKDSLTGVDWQQATTKIFNLNTIATLVYHTSYYVSEVMRFLKGESFNAKDKFSFDCPPIASQEDWQKLIDKTLADTEEFATIVETLPEPKLWENFIDEKYGTYYRNFHGIIEHTHYHLGQIVLIKKILSQTGN